MNKYCCVLPGRKLWVRRGLEVLDARGLGALVEEPGLEVERRRQQGVAVRARRAHSMVRGRPERGLRGGEDRGDVLDGRRGACVEIKFRAPHAIDTTCLRSCVCAMAWRFHAIDATLAPG